MRAVQRIAYFTADQIMKTVRRPSRLVLIPYYTGRSMIRRAQTPIAVLETSEEEVTAASVVPEDVAIAAQKIHVPKEVDSDVGRVFSLVVRDLVDEPFPSGYQISKRWQAHLRHALSKVGDEPSAAVLAYVSLSTFDVELKELSESDRELLPRRRRDFNRKHNELTSLRDSPVCPENTTVAVDGGTHSNKMDQAFSYYDDIYSAIAKTEGLKTIAEIGSGNGRFARIMHLLDPSRRYFLIDLPESLVFAYAFLAVNFPSARTLFISSPADARSAFVGQFDFVFCPIQFIEYLTIEDLDLVLNTYSFCEMPQSSLDYLTDCIHNVLRPRFLYSLNMMFSDKDINFDTGGWDGDANEIVLNLRPEWHVLSCGLTPEIVMGKYRLVGGVVLEHIPGSSQQAAISAAMADADKLKLGSPARIANLYLAAQWSLDGPIIERFFSELAQYCRACNFSADVGYDFERIGEVRYIKRMASICVPCRLNA
jgi:putative sugar O-methyltransferase